MMLEEKYKVVPTKKFIKELAKLSDEDKRRVMDTIRIMRTTPFYPSLRTKKFRKSYESSVNMDIRIFWHFQDSRIIIALDVGHHNVIRKYNKRKF